MMSFNTTFFAFTCFIILCNGVYEVCGAGSNASTGKRKTSATQNKGSTVRNKPELYTLEMCIEYLMKSLGGYEDIIDIIRFLLYNPCPSFSYEKKDLIARRKSFDLREYIELIINTINEDENNPEYSLTPDVDKVLKDKLNIRGSGPKRIGIIQKIMNSGMNYDDAILKQWIDFFSTALSNINFVEKIKNIYIFCAEKYLDKPYKNYKKKSSNKNSGSGSGTGGTSGTGGLELDLNEPYKIYSKNSSNNNSASGSEYNTGGLDVDLNEPLY